MKPRIFIDGEHGTTGLQIRERLAARDDIDVISIAHEDRRDQAKRRDILAEADFALLCLPDDAAREAVSLIEETGNEKCRVIDTSTAHRTAVDWTFGFPELNKEQTDKIIQSNRVSNPGCYSTGAIALLRPLIETGILPDDYPVTINAVSGYTGGGKQLIAQMEDAGREDHIETSFHAYALALHHKHVPEIITRSGLKRRPIFTPSVGRFPQGMLVNIPLHTDLLNGSVSVSSLQATLSEFYGGQTNVEVATVAESTEVPQLRPEDYADRDDMKLWVLGADDTGHVNLTAQLDNLGKGASGAAVQNLDLMLQR